MRALKLQSRICQALFGSSRAGITCAKGRPLREQCGPDGSSRSFPVQPPPVVAGESAALDCPGQDHGALEPYPVILEFAAMLSELKPGKLWKGREFFGYTSETPDCVPLSVAGTNGIALTILHHASSA